MPILNINTKDQNLQLVQSAINTALKPLESIPMVGGLILNGISLVAGKDNLIGHNLGRTPKVFFIGTQKINSTVWSPTTDSLKGANSDATRINLWCSSDCTISLWVN